jgi:hypothetical protein
LQVSHVLSVDAAQVAVYAALRLVQVQACDLDGIDLAKGLTWVEVGVDRVDDRAIAVDKFGWIDVATAGLAFLLALLTFLPTLATAAA